MSDEDKTTDPATKDVEAKDVEAKDVEAPEVEAAEAPEGESNEPTLSGSEAVRGDGVVERSPRGVRAIVGVILLASALIASSAMAGWLYLYQYRPRSTNRRRSGAGCSRRRVPRDDRVAVLCAGFPGPRLRGS